MTYYETPFETAFMWVAGAMTLLGPLLLAALA